MSSSFRVRFCFGPALGVVWGAVAGVVSGAVVGVVLGAFSGLAARAEPHRLTGTAIEELLPRHRWRYEDESTQVFFASGGTNYYSSRLTRGRWRVEGDRYCSVWPPSDVWACYDVFADAQEDGTLVIIFVDSGGGRSVGVALPL